MGSSTVKSSWARLTSTCRMQQLLMRAGHRLLRRRLQRARIWVKKSLKVWSCYDFISSESSIDVSATNSLRDPGLPGFDRILRGSIWLPRLSRREEERNVGMPRAEGTGCDPRKVRDTRRRQVHYRTWFFLQNFPAQDRVPFRWQRCHCQYFCCEWCRWKWLWWSIRCEEIKARVKDVASEIRQMT